MLPPKVLIVDDEPDLVEPLEEVFEAQGFLTKSVFSAASAFEAVEKGFRPDIVLLDITMPRGDGFSFVEKFRDSGMINVPFVCVTAHDDFAHALKALRLGAFDFILKPFRLERLVALIWIAIETSKKQLEIEQLALRPNPNSEKIVANIHNELGLLLRRKNNIHSGETL